jgi:hypothetical protein
VRHGQHQRVKVVQVFDWCQFNAMLRSGRFRLGKRVVDHWFDAEGT